jgi:acetyl esterase/lipase
MIYHKGNVHGIVCIHGGGYFTGNKLQYPSFLANYSKNYLIASINYRLIHKDNNIYIGDILSDIQNALLKILEISNANNINIKGFVLIGHSAGGHIGLLYSCNYFNEKIKINACISLAGPADFTDDIGFSSMTMWGEDIKTKLNFFSWLGTRLANKHIELIQYNWTKQKNYYKFKRFIEVISPVMYVYPKAALPPILLVHGRHDNQVPYSNSVRLNNALDKTSIPHKLITLSGSSGDHMLGGKALHADMPILYSDQAWVKEAMEWMEKLLV